MRKDFHYYLTCVLALKAGCPREDAELIAWSNQKIDELTKAELYGVQTQSAPWGNWHDREVQHSVMIPFHFLPGDNPGNRWMVTPRSDMAQGVLKNADNLISLGIALHSLQDTYSHQGFTGWEEEFNRCYPWWNIMNPQPPIGHAEMSTTPDEINHIWTDPRTEQIIDNKIRAMAAAKDTLNYLCATRNSEAEEIDGTLEPLFAMTYKNRRKVLVNMNEGRRFSEIDEKMTKAYICEFITAARKQKSYVIGNI